MKIKKCNFLPWILCGAVVLAWVIFYVLHVGKLLDSGMASEMVLSEILAKEHGIITPNWNYSSELKVLNNQLFYSLFLSLTGSYHVSRILSGVVLFLLLALSSFYFCLQAGLKKKYPLMLILLFLPVSGEYAYYMLYGMSYIPYVAISFTSIALLLHIRRSAEKKKKILLTVGLFVLAFLAGLGGTRQLVICYIPMLLLFFMESIREKKTTLPEALIALAGGMAGNAVNTNVLSASYHFNSNGDLSFTGYLPEKAGELLMGIFHGYGYTEGPAVFLSVLANICALLIVVCIVHYYVSVFAKNKSRTGEERILSELVLMMAAVYFLLYLFTDLFYEECCVLLFTVFAAPLICFALEHYEPEEKTGFPVWKGMIPLLGLLAVFVAGICTYSDLAGTDKTSALSEISEQLVSQGYDSGYASYWNGNIMTELSDGRFEMFNWDDYVTEKIDVEELYLWNQPISHEEKKPEGKVFILLSTEEEGECPLVRYLTEEEEAARNDDYVAYGFTDYENMLSCLSGFEYDLSEGNWLAGNGKVEHDTWVLPIGSVSNGPNITFYTGDYEILIEGSGIDRLTYDVTAEFGEVTLKDTLAENDTEHMKIAVSVPENTYHVELRLKNITVEDIVITKISIQRKATAGS